MRTLKIDSAKNFQIYNTVLLTPVTMLYVTAPKCQLRLYPKGKYS